MERKVLNPKDEYQMYDRAAKKFGKNKDELLVEYEELTREKGSRHGYGRLVIHECHGSFESDDEGNMKTPTSTGIPDNASEHSDDWEWDDSRNKWRYKVAQKSPPASNVNNAMGFHLAQSTGFKTNVGDGKDDNYLTNMKKNSIHQNKSAKKAKGRELEGFTKAEVFEGGFMLGNKSGYGYQTDGHTLYVGEFSADKKVFGAEKDLESHDVYIGEF